jgi:serine protease Do
MLKKTLVFILFSLLAFVSVFAQESPTAPKKPLETYRALIAPMSIGGSYLGVQIREVSKENMEEFGLREVRGVAIEKVLENSPAAQAGLMINDVVIRFNGEEVTSVRKLNRLISEVAPDHSAKIVVLRNGVEQTFDVKMGKREMPKLFDGNFKFENIPPLTSIPEFKEFPRGNLPELYKDGTKTLVWSAAANRQIGISVSELTKQLGDYFGVSDGKGLLITGVNENSPAAKSGLRAGDVITEINGKAVDRRFDLIKAINEKNEGDISLTIVRDKIRQSISVAPEISKDGIFKFDSNIEGFFDKNSDGKQQIMSPKMRIEPFKFSFSNSTIIL